MKKLTIKMNLEQAKEVYDALFVSPEMHGFADKLISALEKFIEKDDVCGLNTDMFLNMSLNARHIAEFALRGFYDEIKAANPNPEDLFAAAEYLKYQMKHRWHSRRRYKQFDTACDFCGELAMESLIITDDDLKALFMK